MQTSTHITDERISPYFIKLVNSSYEVHQTHTPKEEGKSQYTKFVCAKDNIRQAVSAIVKRKLSLKRRTKKTVSLAEYLVEIKEMQNVVESLLDDDSPERQIRLLKRRMDKLEKTIENLNPKTPVTSTEEIALQF